MHNETNQQVSARGRALRIDVRVTPREYQRIKSRARKAGIGMSAYMRSRALNDSKNKMTIDVDADELRAAYANLKRAGSNINQCARALNTYGQKGCSEERAIAAMQHVSAAADAVAAALALVRNGEAIA